MATKSLMREQEQSHRAEAVQAALADSRGDQLTEGMFDAIAMTVADTAATPPLENEIFRTLADQLDRLLAELGASANEADPEQAEARGRLLGYRQVVHWLLQRAVSDSVIVDLNPSTHAYSFLRSVDERPGMNNSELRERLGVGESEVSRVGRRVYGAGLAQKRRIGGTNYWEITPRGRRALEVADQRYGLGAKEHDPELRPVFKDIAAALVGALLETNLDSAERGQLEAEVVTTAGEMLKSAGVAVEAKPDLAARFLDTLDSDLHDIQSVVNGSKQLVGSDFELVRHAIGKAGTFHGVLSAFEVTTKTGLAGRGRSDLRLAKANDGTWLVATGIAERGARKSRVGKAKT
jgi:DNA-binding MarR family transcriptional regulator